MEASRHRPVFPRDAMRVQPMPSCGVCVSVSPFVTFVNSVNMSNRIFKKIFSPYVAKPF